MSDDFRIITQVVYDVPEHQVVISFDSDEAAVQFTEWFRHVGKELWENRTTYK
jgi:hypothetical protein